MNSFIITLAAIVLIGAALLFFIGKRRRRLSERDTALIISGWRNMEIKIEREPKQALIEADKFLDFVLKKKGYTGSLGEKLKVAGPLFSHINNVRDAHKLRNRVVHEVGFVLAKEQARRAVFSIRRALEDLGVKFK